MGWEDLLLLLIKRRYKSLTLEEEDRSCFPAARGQSVFHADTKGKKGKRPAGQKWDQRDNPCHRAGSPPGDGANKHRKLLPCTITLQHLFTHPLRQKIH